MAFLFINLKLKSMYVYLLKLKGVKEDFFIDEEQYEGLIESITATEDPIILQQVNLDDHSTIKFGRSEFDYVSEFGERDLSEFYPATDYAEFATSSGSIVCKITNEDVGLLINTWSDYVNEGSQDNNLVLPVVDDKGVKLNVLVSNIKYMRYNN